jgi:hypothetical protein
MLFVLCLVLAAPGLDLFVGPLPVIVNDLVSSQYTLGTRFLIRDFPSSVSSVSINATVANSSYYYSVTRVSTAAEAQQFVAPSVVAESAGRFVGNVQGTIDPLNPVTLSIEYNCSASFVIGETITVLLFNSSFIQKLEFSFTKVCLNYTGTSNALEHSRQYTLTLATAQSFYFSIFRSFSLIPRSIQRALVYPAHVTRQRLHACAIQDTAGRNASTTSL